MPGRKSVLSFGRALHGLRDNVVGLRDLLLRVQVCVHQGIPGPLYLLPGLRQPGLDGGTVLLDICLDLPGGSLGPLGDSRPLIPGAQLAQRVVGPIRQAAVLGSGRYVIGTVPHPLGDAGLIRPFLSLLTGIPDHIHE